MLVYAYRYLLLRYDIYRAMLPTFPHLPRIFFHRTYFEKRTWLITTEPRCLLWKGGLNYDTDLRCNDISQYHACDDALAPAVARISLGMTMSLLEMNISDTTFGTWYHLLSFNNLTHCMYIQLFVTLVNKYVSHMLFMHKGNRLLVLWCTMD